MPEHVSWHDGGGDLVVFNRLDGTYHAFDGIGSDIWRAIARDGRLGAVIAELRHRYEDDGRAIDDDLDWFVEHASSLGLLVVSQP